MLLGTLLVFAPALALALRHGEGLFGVWGAKALLNAWRLLSAVCVILTRLVSAPR